MTDLQNKIVAYFDRDEDLKVLFIFDDNGFMAMELEGLEWPVGYRYVDFAGDWFTTKYNLDNEWAHEKVILMLHQSSPVQSKAMCEKFPLMDVLIANAEYHHQDYTAFMQQFGIPDKMQIFVQKNINMLQSSQMMNLLKPYYQDGNINHDIAVRAFISNLMGQGRVLDWDNIIVRMILMGRAVDQKKQVTFYANLRNKTKEVQPVLEEKLRSIFGITFDASDANIAMAPIVRTLKYNAVVQNLAPAEADNYKQYRISDTLALQQMNRILELALSQEKSAKALLEVFAELGSDIREEEIIRWYGTDANYYFLPEELCVPIIKTLMETKIDSEPEHVAQRLEELTLKHGDNREILRAIQFGILVSHYYEKALPSCSQLPKSADEYVQRYCTDLYLLDQLYRQALNAYFDINPSSPLFETAQQIKVNLDLNYHKLSNRINLDWMRTVKESGGFKAVNLMRQQDFYDKTIRPMQKKVAVIVSDAFRYELADELIGELAKSKHTAQLKPALAMLPTETKFCKPSLLPYNDLMLYNDGEDKVNMAVDHKILSDLAKRTAQVDGYRQGGVCVSFEEVAEYNQDKNRELFKHPLVYIFHDDVDHVGHDCNGKTVVQTCKRAIEDIATMIPKIHASYNVSEVYVTADHGFLFNDIEFAEKDKQPVSEKTLERKSRYYLTESTAEISGIAKFPLKEVSGMESDVLVAVPTGTNRLAAPAGEYVFCHGGATLQEMIIPVLVSQERESNDKVPVGVAILDQRLTITASRLRFKMVQTEAVSMANRERQISVALYHNDTVVSPVKTFLLDKTDQSLENRKVLVDLTLSQKVDANVLQVKVFDTDDPLNPLIRENVTNKTLINDEFEF